MVIASADHQLAPWHLVIKLATKHVFANVSSDKDIVDANAKSVNVVAVSVRAVSQSFLGWLALSVANINLEP